MDAALVEYGDSVIAPLAPPVEAKVRVPFAPLPPETPSVGVTVQLEAVVLDVFGIIPALLAEVAFVPPPAIGIVGRSPVAIAEKVPT